MNAPRRVGIPASLPAPSKGLDVLAGDVLAYYENLAHGGKGIDVLKIRRSHLAALVAIAKATLNDIESGAMCPGCESCQPPSPPEDTPTGGTP